MTFHAVSSRDEILQSRNIGFSHEFDVLVVRELRRVFFYYENFLLFIIQIKCALFTLVEKGINTTFQVIGDFLKRSFDCKTQFCAEGSFMLLVLYRLEYS